jgi:hypothetical protein
MVTRKPPWEPVVRLDGVCTETTPRSSGEAVTEMLPSEMLRRELLPSGLLPEETMVTHVEEAT